MDTTGNTESRNQEAVVIYSETAGVDRLNPWRLSSSFQNLLELIIVLHFVFENYPAAVRIDFELMIRSLNLPAKEPLLFKFVIREDLLLYLFRNLLCELLVSERRTRLFIKLAYVQIGIDVRDATDSAAIRFALSMSF